MKVTTPQIKIQSTNKQKRPKQIVLRAQSRWVARRRMNIDPTSVSTMPVIAPAFATESPADINT
jgi:hypothetical protein